jgi:hypothetical protein
MKSLPLAVILLALAGCGDLSYHGNSPNVRTFSEEPTMSQYYIGWDFEFAVVDPPAAAATDAAAPSAEEIREPQSPVDDEDLPRDLPQPSFLD